MVKSSSRCGRLGDLMHRELAALIRDEVSDPRIGMVTISSVVVTEDLSFARVYITVLENDKQKISLEILNHAAGFFRAQLSRKSTLRSMPKISFIYDKSLEIGTRIDQLLNSVKPHGQENHDEHDAE
jgi:ribosome-binding factor A